MRLLAQFAFLLSALFAANANADTFLQLNGTPGDFITSGTSQHLTPADMPTFTVNQQADGTVHVALLNSTVPTSIQWWDVYFKAAGGPVTVGIYEYAERWPFQTAGHAGFDVGGSGRGCNQLLARFVVHEISYAANGSLATFAADFEQHCEFAAAAAYGGVRFNSSVPYVDALSSPVPGMLRLTRAAFGSSPAVDILKTNDGRTMSGRSYNSGANITYQDGTVDFWQTFFVPANGATLAPGVYESAKWGATGAENFLGISGWGPSCLPVRGRFVVHEVEIAPYGYVKRFAADFAAYCDDGSDVPMYGGVRYNSTVPYTQIAAPAAGATQLQFVDATRSFTVGTGYPLYPVQVATVDASGNRVANSEVTATAGCGRFSNGTTMAVATSDANGIVTLPTWTAPEIATSCTIYVSLNLAPNSYVIFPIDVYSAGRLELADGRTTFDVPIGGKLIGISILTLSATGARVPNQSVGADALCGAFPNGELAAAFFSDANGVATLPDWTAPSDTQSIGRVCNIRIGRLGSVALNVFVTMRPPLPETAATRLAYVDGERFFTVRGGETLSGIRVASVISDGVSRLGNQAVWAATNGCGTFGGGSSVQIMTDASGVGVLPAWTAPATAVDCAIYSQLQPGNTATQLPFVITVLANTPPPPSPAIPITTRMGSSPAGGAVTVSIVNAGSCSLGDLTVLNPAATELFNFPPAQLAYARHGYIDFRVDGCSSGQAVTFTFEFPEDLPPTAQWWKLGPTPDHRSNHWYVIPSTVNGKRITFTIADGGLGDDDLAVNGSIRDLGMVTVPGGAMQDLWWSGLAENGWGMTLVHHRDILFGNMFVYDANGVATWYVMPSGSFDSTHTVYTGALYLPKGSPYFAYDVSKFDIGAAVGTARIAFNGVNEATFEYTINGITGRKNISRIPFGPVAPPTDKPLGDLWWAGLAQNGWGLVISQQYATLFGLWFTYDANGKATWFVMPNIEFVSKDIYRGNIYRPEGPPWLGVAYDPARHRTVQVGTFTLRFSGDAATFDYTIDGKSGSIPISRIPF